MKVQSVGSSDANEHYEVEVGKGDIELPSDSLLDIISSARGETVADNLTIEELRDFVSRQLPG